MNDFKEWRNIYGSKSPRLRDQELILRILALYMRSGKYSRPLKKFLNDFLGDYRELDNFPATDLEELFLRSSALLFEAEGRSALRVQSRSQVNAAFTEAVFVSLMGRISSGRTISATQVRSALQKLVSDPAMATAISGSTANEENVNARISIARGVFADRRR